MLDPCAYVGQSANQINTKFGLHDKHFATLADVHDFYQLLEWIGGVDHLIDLDIGSELAQITSDHNAELYFRVPTLGFTDPAFDFDMRPWFAAPIGLNGFGCQRDNPWASLPHKIIAVDLMGNHYPILFNQEHRIDYEVIGAHAQAQGQKLFTTLRALIFVYSYQQVIAGTGLWPLPYLSTLKNKALFLPPQHAYACSTIEVGLMHGGDVTQSRTILIKKNHTSEVFHLNNFALGVRQQGENVLDVFIDGQMVPHLAMNQFSLTVSLPKQNIDLSALSLEKYPFEIVNDHLRTTQVYGLSQKALQSTLKILIPKDNLKQAFVGSPVLNTHVFNDFSFLNAMSNFYEIVLQGVMNTSIPLMALESMFEHCRFPEMIQAISKEEWSAADCQVYQELTENLQNLSEKASYEFAARLDQMLMLDKFYPQLHLSIPVGQGYHLESLESYLYFEPLDGSSDLNPQAFKAGKGNFEALDTTLEIEPSLNLAGVSICHPSAGTD